MKAEALIHKIKRDGKLPESYKDLHEGALEFLGKLSSVKAYLGNIGDDRIEFKLDERDAASRLRLLTTVVEKASDEAEWKSEYLRHMVDLLHKVVKDGADVSERLDDLPDTLERLNAIDAKVGRSWFDLKDGEHAKDDVIAFAKAVLGTIAKSHQRLKPSETKFIKSLLKSDDVSIEDVDSYLKSDHLTRQLFTKEFNL